MELNRNRCVDKYERANTVKKQRTKTVINRKLENNLLG